MRLYFLNDVVNDTESIDIKFDNDVINTTLKSESTGKLINRLPGWHLLISSLPGSASRTHVNKRSQSLAL